MTGEPLQGLSEEKTSVLRMARTARRLIAGILIVLPSYFAWLSVKSTSLDQAMTVLAHKDLNIWKLFGFVYFFSWILGAHSDINDQENVYVAGREGGKIPIPGILVVVALALAGWGLLSAASFEHFALALALFMAVYFVSWAYMHRVIVGPLAEASIQAYAARNDFPGAEKVKALRHFLLGRWQVVRFAVGGVFALVMLLIAAAKYFGLAPFANLDETFWTAAQAIGLLVFVLVMDGWLWFMRVRMKAALNAVDLLKGKYRLEPIGPAAR
jgi:hypothetical protein